MNWEARNLSCFSDIPTPPGEGLDRFLQEHLHQGYQNGINIFYQGFFCRLYFLSQVLPGNLQSVLHPRSKSSSKGGSQIHGELAIHKLGWESAPLSWRAHRLQRSHCPALAWRQLVTAAVWTHRGAKPKYAPFSTSVAQGWTATLKEMSAIPPARFRLPKGNKAGCKIATLSWTLWGNSKANLFHLSWTHTQFWNGYNDAK